MLRASWALLSLPFIPGARPRLDRPLPAFFSRQDRYFVATLKKFTAKNDFLAGPTPEVASDDTGKPEAGPDPFTPSIDIPPTFRFPPFPLALADEPLAKISVEPESDTEKDIFEAPSVEYRAYERLPPASADILTEVVRTLPEMLPEPETDPGSMFEDKAQDDYIGIVTSNSPPMTSTQSLEMLIAQKDYAQAERVLEELLHFGTEIPFSFSYEMAAIAAVKIPATTSTEMDDQVKTFRKWFSLIPLAHQSPPRKFRTLRRYIMHTPLNSLKLIMEFSLIAAEKGYATSTHHHAIGVVCMYGDPEHTLSYIEQLRSLSRSYLHQYAHRHDIARLDRRLHVDMIGFAVRRLANAGRFDHAVQLVPDPLQTDTYLSSYTWLFLLNRLKKTNDPQYEPHIKFVEQHQSEEIFKAVGLKKMATSTLVSAIRCLAYVRRLDLAVPLLPKLQEKQPERVIEPFDVLLPRLRELRAKESSRLPKYVEILRGISQQPETSQSTAAAIVDFIASPPSASTEEETVPRTGDVLQNTIYALARAWCLEEAIALIPAYHQSTASRDTSGLYALLLKKIKTSHNSKYHRYHEVIEKLTNSLRRPTVKVADPSRTLAPAASKPVYDEDAIKFLESFSAEDVFLTSSFPSGPPQLIVTDMAASLRALKRAFRALTPSHRPHPLTIVRFMELYLATGRTRAITLLRNYVLKQPQNRQPFIFAEMLFHARFGNPDLVIWTFATHYYMVGVPRDDIITRLRNMELDPADVALWGCTPPYKLYPNPRETAVIWRALLKFMDDEGLMEKLYGKLLQYADPSRRTEPELHPGLPLFQPPPAWATAVDESTFTPFVRSMGTAFGNERGALVVKEMGNVGLTPTIYQLTELAMLYSRSGDVERTFYILNQVESQRDQDSAIRVDQVFYVAIARGFLISNQLQAALAVERRMIRRYGFKAGKSRLLDELYEDIRTASQGRKVPHRDVDLSVVYNQKYRSKPQARGDPEFEPLDASQLHAPDNPEALQEG